MIILTPSEDQRKQARLESKTMGILYNSFTKGLGNEIGMMGEILVHNHVGGERVGNTNFAYDLIAKNKITVDVKTTKAAKVPEPHYVARVYGKESDAEKIASKCNVYYFVRCNQQMSLATIVGWITAREFIDKAIFLPRGNVDPSDGKLSFADEYTLPISELHPPSVKMTKKHLKGVG